MKKNIFFILFLIIFVLFYFSSFVLAQDTETSTSSGNQTQTSPERTNPNLVPTIVSKPKVSGPQRVSTSNMACVKVGEARDEDKSALCNQPGQTDTGFIGPIGAPTLESCGEDYLSGEALMCIKPAYVFYCQGDSRWGNVCNMSQAGCGPTTMAMIFSAYGDTVTPLEMDRDIFQKRGWRACGDNVSYMQTAIQTLLPENGYEYHALGAPLDLTRAQEYLNAGYLIIGSTFGHIFVIDGIDIANQTLRLRDPGRCENKDGVIRSASTPWGGQRLIYSYAVKKIVK